MAPALAPVSIFSLIQANCIKCTVLYITSFNTFSCAQYICVVFIKIITKHCVILKDPLSGTFKTEFETPLQPKYQVGGGLSEDPVVGYKFYRILNKKFICRKI